MLEEYKMTFDNKEFYENIQKAISIRKGK